MKGNSMPTSLHIRTIVLGILVCFVVLPHANAQKPKLSRAQVEQLIQIHQPDDVTASLIRNRGLSFPVTRKIVEALAAKGAKPLTLAALRDQIHLGTGRVVVETTSDSLIYLDGNQVGKAGADGLFLMSSVVEGDHEVIVRNDGYREASSKFSLDSNEDKHLSLPIEWLGGYLTISAQPLSARIQVAGPWSFEGSATDGKTPPGSYTATVSSDGYITQTRNFQIGAGEHHAEQFKLAIDIAAAQARANAGDQASLEMLYEALDHGETITCDVKTNGFDIMAGSTLNDEVITVSRAAISYGNFTVSPDKIVDVVNNPAQISSVSLKIATMNKKGTKENKKNFLFYNHGAAFVVVGNSGTINLVNLVCNGCDNSMNVLYALLQRVRGGN
jgi:PEGA domain